MERLKLLVGKVKNNTSESWQGAEGIELIVFQLDNEEELSVIRPISLDDMERFYKLSYEKTLKEMISDDYKYCLWYVINEDCELTIHIDKNDLENIREAIKEDFKEHNKNLEVFKINNGFYDINNQIKLEEETEEKAIEEFSNTPKEKVSVQTTHGYMTVDAVIYKGFAVHSTVGYEDKSLLSITILKGFYAGMALTKCNITKYKQLIDEIKEFIGDKIIDFQDSNRLKEIIYKYYKY